MRNCTMRRRLLTSMAAGGAGLAIALLGAPSASAAGLPQPSVSPAINVSDGFHPTTVTISGTGCVPKPGKPASVTLTVDHIAGTFSAKPAADGSWSVDVPITTQDAGAVHATCHNYRGSTSYPEQRIVFFAIAAASSSAPPSTSSPTPTTVSDPPLATTGNHSTTHFEVGVLSLAGGGALTWLGRRRLGRRAI